MQLEKQHVRDVSERSFKAEVLDRSVEVPVVVDFWADWCGPCRLLGPLLERLAAEFNGAFQLVKVDVDRNPRLAAEFGVQGIPAVKAFRDGRVVAEFVGAQPEPVVREFLRKILPTPADALAARARLLENEGWVQEAEDLYRQALSGEPDHAASLLGLGRVLLAQDRETEALSYLDQALRFPVEGAEARRLLALAGFQREAGACPDEAVAQQRLTDNPADLDARYCLAMHFASHGRYADALEHLLTIVRRDRKYRDDAARKAMLEIFDVLGEDNTLTPMYRSKLAAVLF